MTWRGRLRRLRLAVLALLSVTVIVLGVLAGLTQLAMPWLQHHPQYVESWLSDRVGRSVSIGHLTGAWVGGGPVLTLDEVRIAAKAGAENALVIPHAQLAFDLSALFRRNRAVSEFRLAGLDLQIVNEDGGWHLRGLDLDSAGDDGSEPFSMGALGAVEITDVKLAIVDAAHDFKLALGVPVLRLLNRGDHLRLVGRVRLLDTDSPPLELVADVDPTHKAGELYVGGRDIDLARVAAQQSPFGVELGAGRGQLQLWVRFTAGAPEDVRARVDLHDVQLGTDETLAIDEHTRVTPRVAFDRLAFVARWLRRPDGWMFDLADFIADRGVPAAPARLGLQRSGESDDVHYRAGVIALPLEPLGNVAILVDRLPAGLRQWLYLAHPRGSVESADVTWNGRRDYAVNASVRGLGLGPAGAAPGVERIDLDVHADADALLAQLPSQAVRVDYPHVFRKPFLFSTFGGDVIARRTDDAWRIETGRLAFEGEGFGGEIRGSVDLPDDGKPPALDMYAALSHADVTAARLFWPTVAMQPKAIAWLDRALVGGQVLDGRIAIRGDLANWPFHDHSGVMVAHAQLEDFELEYDDNWPRARDVHASIAFVNDSLRLDVDRGEALGNRIRDASAVIEDFGPLVLDLRVKGDGSGANLLGFLRATPLGKQYEAQLKDIEIGGKGVVGFTMNLPIRQMESMTLEGDVELADAKLDDNAFNLHFLDANGHLRFGKNGFSADAIDVMFRERKAKLSMAVGAYVADPSHAFEASLTGRFPVAKVFADVPVLAPAFAHFPGESEWAVGISIAASEAGDGRKRLSLTSDLRGTGIDLPAPLRKAEDASLPFRLGIDLPFEGQVFSAALGSLVSVEGRVPSAVRPFAASVAFGAGSAGQPPAQGVAIGGRVAELDAGAWIDLAPGAGSGSGNLLQGIDVRADDLLFGSRHFPDIRLRIDNAATATVIGVEGASMQGSLSIPNGSVASTGVTAKFERIHWPDGSPDDEADAPDTNALSDVAPGSLPALHLSVGDLRLGSARFGSAQFESRPIANGMHIDKLEALSPNIAMKASGDWTGTAKSNRTRLSIDLSAQNLGHMMDALGFPGIIDGGTTHGTIDANWPGPPSGFALQKLEGTLAINVAEGRILEVDTPSAGRIFGLFSLTEIPRRLSLDFSDFFKSGFSFNSIIGKFRFTGGNAYTDDLTIKSPAADIVVTGRTGLRSKDYDQQMNVTPHAGSTLPIVGAIAAGPVGAAAGLVVQGILNKPLGRAMTSRYQVTGSWAKPTITLIAKFKRAKRDADGAVDAPDPQSP